VTTPGQRIDPSHGILSAPAAWATIETPLAVTADAASSEGKLPTHKTKRGGGDGGKPDNTVIAFNPVNPKQAGSKSFGRYAVYCSAKNLGELRALNPGFHFKADLRHDLRVGYATLSPPPPEPGDSVRIVGLTSWAGRAANGETGTILREIVNKIVKPGDLPRYEVSVDNSPADPLRLLSVNF
jgi:hypothetical protein